MGGNSSDNYRCKAIKCLDIRFDCSEPTFLYGGNGSRFPDRLTVMSYDVCLTIHFLQVPVNFL